MDHVLWLFGIVVALDRSYCFCWYVISLTCTFWDSLLTCLSRLLSFDCLFIFLCSRMRERFTWQLLSILFVQLVIEKTITSFCDALDFGSENRWNFFYLNLSSVIGILEQMEKTCFFSQWKFELRISNMALKLKQNKKKCHCNIFVLTLSATTHWKSTHPDLLCFYYWLCYHT